MTGSPAHSSPKKASRNFRRHEPASSKSISDRHKIRLRVWWTGTVELKASVRQRWFVQIEGEDTDERTIPYRRSRKTPRDRQEEVVYLDIVSVELDLGPEVGKVIVNDSK